MLKSKLTSAVIIVLKQYYDRVQHLSHDLEWVHSMTRKLYHVAGNQKAAIKNITLVQHDITAQSFVSAFFLFSGYAEANCYHSCESYFPSFIH